MSTVNMMMPELAKIEDLRDDFDDVFARYIRVGNLRGQLVRAETIDLFSTVDGERKCTIANPIYGLGLHREHVMGREHDAAIVEFVNKYAPDALILHAWLYLYEYAADQGRAQSDDAQTALNNVRATLQRIGRDYDAETLAEFGSRRYASN